MADDFAYGVATQVAKDAIRDRNIQRRNTRALRDEQDRLRLEIQKGNRYISNLTNERDTLANTVTQLRAEVAALKKQKKEDAQEILDLQFAWDRTKAHVAGDRARISYLNEELDRISGGPEKSPARQVCQVQGESGIKTMPIPQGPREGEPMTNQDFAFFDAHGQAFIADYQSFWAQKGVPTWTQFMDGRILD